MHVHVEVKVFELSRLQDQSRHGRWATVELWDQSQTPQRLLATHSHCFGNEDEPIDAMIMQTYIAELADKLVRFLGLNPDNVINIGNPLGLGLVEVVTE